MKRLLLGLPLLFSSQLALADEEDELDSGRVVAIEDRPYRMVHEFTVSGGVLPIDALYTGLTIGGSYTLHLSDLWAWEAVSFHYSANVDTGLDVTLAERWSVAPTSNPEIQYMIGSHAILTPLFGKIALFNDSIIHASTFFALGGGVSRFSTGFRPMGSFGPGIRVFFGQVVSTRLDVRGAIVPDVPTGVDFILQVTLSVSFNFGSVRATELGDDDAIVDETTGFEALDELYPQSNPTLGATTKKKAEKTEEAAP
jgi:outer membrane beta-barrel protein